MPFESKAQMRAAFGGYLGKEMKQKAKQWAAETPSIASLPKHKKAKQYSPEAIHAAYKMKGGK